MRILRSHKKVPEDCRHAVLAMGNFDGVHRGHQAVLGTAAKIARDLNAPLGVLVFEPHPRVFFRPETPAFRLTMISEKARQLEVAGVDIVMAFTFDREMADTSAENFVNELLFESLGVCHVVVGENFRFGRQRSGDIELLRDLAEKNGFGTTFVQPFLLRDEVCSSSRVRTCLREGRPSEAAHLLGHWWAIEGEVLSGDQRGRQLGFPTANLSLQDYVEPKFAVYAVRIGIENTHGEIKTQHNGVANIGRRPTFDKEDVTLEVHIFDFSEDIYGGMARVSLIEFIRPERKFDGLDSLKAQIAADSKEAQRILALENNKIDRFAGVPDDVKTS